MTTEHVSVPREWLERLSKLDWFNAPKGAAAEICVMAQTMLQHHDMILSRATPSDDSAELNYAKSLATSMWERHYAKDAPQWELCDDLYGVLSQIDNMLTGLVREKTSAPRVVTDRDIASWADRHDLSFGGSKVDARAAFEDAQSFATSLPAAIPPGYVVVPVEPTVDMHTAGAIAHSQAEESCRIELAQEDDIVFSQCPADSMRWRKNRAAYVYKSMLAAAPQAGERG